MKGIFSILLVAITALHGVPLHVCLCALPAPGAAHCDAAEERPVHGCCESPASPSGPTPSVATETDCACPTVTASAPLEADAAPGPSAAGSTVTAAALDQPPLARPPELLAPRPARSHGPPPREPLFLLHRSLRL